MFGKVIIAEDQDVISHGVRSTLNELDIETIDHSQYCDEALLKLRKAQQENTPYELLISDLSFVKDHTEQKLNSGEELIASVRKEFPDLKIIVFSVEEKSYTIQKLYNSLGINGYVLKSRNGARELKQAIQHTSNYDNIYVSPSLTGILNSQNAVEVTDDDMYLIACLGEGLSHENITVRLKERGVRSSSISAVEKRVKFLREHFNANNTIHLVSLAKDLGLI